MGFEDTPDYDYLRELFTQALKNTGEVEDGNYDWMMLNNGKGWEATKHHPQHLQAANAVPNPTQRAIGGGANTPRGPGTPGAPPMNSGHVVPQSPAKPGVSKAPRDRQGVIGGLPPKRGSAALGGLNDVTPTASTQAQFQSSTANLQNIRMSQANPGNHQTSAAQQGSRNPNTETQPSTMQKIMKALCCSR